MNQIIQKTGARAWLRSPVGMCVVLAISGIVLGLCVSFAWGLVEWIALVPALMIFFSLARDERVSLRKMYGYGFVFNYAFSLVLFHWFFYMYPLEFTGVTPIAALAIVLFATLGLALLQTLFGALVPVLLAIVSRGRVVRRFAFLQVIVMASLWCVREWCQTLTWTGVPWGRLALGQADMPIMLQTARWFGSYAITFVIVLVSGCVAYALLHANARRLCALVGVGAFALHVAASAGLLLTDSSRPGEGTITVAAIQGNIGSADKWNTGSSECYDIYFALTEQAAERGADVIVWPETAVPITLADYPAYVTALGDLAREHEVVLLLGVFADGEDGAEYNAMCVIDEKGTLWEQIYAKRHLVPFGEYVPLRWLIEIICPPLLQISQLSGDTTPGDEASVFDTVYGRFGSLICFDSIYEQLAYDSAREGAELLCISTNDSWFFDSAAVHMHNAQARLRAIETGRYIVRAANTGVSSVITATGRELDRIPALEEGILMAEVELRGDTTLYTRIGNYFVYDLLAAMLLLLMERGVWTIKARMSKNGKK
ncbi:MAG: apolipoprotein N-acyltransferase [Ruminococcaceae bacterium]|nr:apolipoprotein N-acyltransferase [Oscillospiraceae bacterium]